MDRKIQMRLTPGMGVIEATDAICGDNLGARSVCGGLVNISGDMDADDVFGGLGFMMIMDTLNIHDGRIWKLYNDVCGRELPKMMAVLLSCQLGYLPAEELNHSIDNYGDGIDVDGVMGTLRERITVT